MPAAEASHWGPGATLYPVNWNGYWIYLSPAHHYTGDNPGCSGYVEDQNMRSAAYALAQDLVGRQYRVRIGNGDPTQNTNESNAMVLAPRYHIPMHSNGSTTNGALCLGQRGGTEAYNVSGNAGGSYLAQEFVNKLGPVSPGSGDQRTPLQATALHELQYVRAVVAYLEADFHDWRPGRDWLVTHYDWVWYLSWAIDTRLGYPRV